MESFLQQLARFILVRSISEKLMLEKSFSIVCQLNLKPFALMDHGRN